MPTRWPVVALGVLLAHGALLGLLGLGLQQARPFVDSLVAVQWLPAPLALAALPPLAHHATQGTVPPAAAARLPADRAPDPANAASARSHRTAAPALPPSPVPDPSAPIKPKAPLEARPPLPPALAPMVQAAPLAAAASPASAYSLGPARAASGTGLGAAASPAHPQMGAPAEAAPGHESTPHPSPSAQGAGAPPVLVPPSAARHLHNPAPPYPALSRRLGEQGRVLLRVRIESDGRASQVLLQQSSGFARLDQAALQTVPHWRFVPGTRNGVAEAMWFQVPVQFVLE